MILSGNFYDHVVIEGDLQASTAFGISSAVAKLPYSSLIVGLPVEPSAGLRTRPPDMGSPICGSSALH